jgi:bacillopeptidase F (M6 metalloprotease family)
MPYITAEVDVDLGEFDTKDLLDELKFRGEMPSNAKELLETIWLKRRLGNHDYQTELDQLIYQVLGYAI